MTVFPVPQQLARQEWRGKRATSATAASRTLGGPAATALHAPVVIVLPSDSTTRIVNLCLILYA